MNFTVEGGNVPVTIQRFLYGYDRNGNRTFARVTQAGHDNDRSFLYQYDHFHRLINAEYGKLKPAALYRLKTLLAW
jgi:hypothetical protein